MNFFARYKNVFLFIFIFAILAGGYAYFFGGEGEEPLVAISPSGTATEVGRELLTLGATLRSIELDDLIFEDPAFQALQDFSQELTPESVGRRNPFAPLGTGAGE